MKTIMAVLALGSLAAAASSALPVSQAAGLRVQSPALGGFTMQDPLASVYGNTVLVTNGNQTQKLWLRADHTFSWEGFRGIKGEGTWTLSENNRRICLTPAVNQRPTAEYKTAKPRCAEFLGPHKAGERWEQTNDANQKVTVEIRHSE